VNEYSEPPLYSFWPLFLATGMLLVAVGIVWSWGISILGLLLMFASIIGWVWENRTERREEGNE
jgi:hypothetical protein